MNERKTNSNMEPEEFLEEISDDAKVLDTEDKVLVLWVDYSKYRGMDEYVDLEELIEDISHTLDVSVLALPNKVDDMESAGLEELSEKLEALQNRVDELI